MACLHTLSLLVLTAALAAVEVAVASSLPPAAWWVAGGCVGLSLLDRVPEWRSER